MARHEGQRDRKYHKHTKGRKDNRKPRSNAGKKLQQKIPRCPYCQVSLRGINAREDLLTTCEAEGGERSCRMHKACKEEHRRRYEEVRDAGRASPFPNINLCPCCRGEMFPPLLYTERCTNCARGEPVVFCNTPTCDQIYCQTCAAGLSDAFTRSSGPWLCIDCLTALS